MGMVWDRENKCWVKEGDWVEPSDWEWDMSKDKKATYYDAGGIEVQDVIEAKLTPGQYRGYLLGNIIKYACRLNFKGNTDRDAEKLANYSAWLKELGREQQL